MPMLAFTVLLLLGCAALAGASGHAEIATCATGICDVDVSLMQVASRGQRAMGRAAPKTGGVDDQYVAIAAQQRQNHSKHHGREVALMQVGSSPLEDHGAKPPKASMSAAEQRSISEKLRAEIELAAAANEEIGPPSKSRPPSGLANVSSNASSDLIDLAGLIKSLVSDSNSQVFDSNSQVLIRSWGLWAIPLLMIIAVLGCALVWLICLLMEPPSQKNSKLSADHSKSASLLFVEKSMQANSSGIEPCTSGARMTMSAISTGRDVEVLEGFLSNSEPRKKLRKGLRGRVRLIDADGDAEIDFEGLPETQWVFSEHFDRLRVVERKVRKAGGDKAARDERALRRAARASAGDLAGRRLGRTLSVDTALPRALRPRRDGADLPSSGDQSTDASAEAVPRLVEGEAALRAAEALGHVSCAETLCQAGVAAAPAAQAATAPPPRPAPQSSEAAFCLAPPRAPSSSVGSAAQAAVILDACEAEADGEEERRATAEDAPAGRRSRLGEGAAAVAVADDSDAEEALIGASGGARAEEAAICRRFDDGIDSASEDEDGPGGSAGGAAQAAVILDASEASAAVEQEKRLACECRS